MPKPLITPAGRAPRPLRVAFVTLAVGVLLWASLAPRKDVPGAELFWDKAEHASAYFVLMMVGLLFAPRRPRAFTVFALSLGLTIEILQALMPYGRQGDWRDMAANSVGVLVGGTIWYLVRRRPRT